MNKQALASWLDFIAGFFIEVRFKGIVLCQFVLHILGSLQLYGKKQGVRRVDLRYPAFLRHTVIVLRDICPKPVVQGGVQAVL